MYLHVTAGGLVDSPYNLHMLRGPVLAGKEAVPQTNCVRPSVSDKSGTPTHGHLEQISHHV